MGAVVLADPGGGSRPESRRRYVVPTLLIAGWIGLFAYSAAYLTEDLPFRPQKPDTSPIGEPTAGPRTVAGRVVMLDPPAAASPPGLREAPPLAEASRLPVASLPVRPAPAPVNADYVGTWGPTASACSGRSRRRGYIPATITQDQARAGRTICTFHDMRRSGGAWVTVAECSDRGRRWASQVRLTVDDDHLTWSSSRGTVSYTRCNRRSG